VNSGRTNVATAPGPEAGIAGAAGLHDRVVPEANTIASASHASIATHDAPVTSKTTPSAPSSSARAPASSPPAASTPKQDPAPNPAPSAPAQPTKNGDEGSGLLFGGSPSSASATHALTSANGSRGASSNLASGPSAGSSGSSGAGGGAVDGPVDSCPQVKDPDMKHEILEALKSKSPEEKWTHVATAMDIQAGKKDTIETNERSVISRMLGDTEAERSKRLKALGFNELDYEKMKSFVERGRTSSARYGLGITLGDLYRWRQPNGEWGVEGKHPKADSARRLRDLLAAQRLAGLQAFGRFTYAVKGSALVCADRPVMNGCPQFGNPWMIDGDYGRKGDLRAVTLGFLKTLTAYSDDLFFHNPNTIRDRKHRVFTSYGDPVGPVRNPPSLNAEEVIQKDFGISGTPLKDLKGENLYRPSGVASCHGSNESSQILLALLYQHRSLMAGKCRNFAENKDEEDSEAEIAKFPKVDPTLEKDVLASVSVLPGGAVSFMGCQTIKRRRFVLEVMMSSVCDDAKSKRVELKNSLKTYCDSRDRKEQVQESDEQACGHCYGTFVEGPDGKMKFIPGGLKD